MSEHNRVCICDQPEPDGFSRCQNCGLTTLPQNIPVRLVSTKPDVEVAEELKAELLKALKPAEEVATKALALGFQVQMNMAPDMFKRVKVQMLQLVKVF